GARGRRLLGGEGEAEGGPAAVLRAEGAQPQARVRARQGGARVPHSQMPVRLSQGALPRHHQERRAGLVAAGARQSVSRTAALGRSMTGELGPPLSAAALQWQTGPPATLLAGARAPRSSAPFQSDLTRGAR